MSAIDDLFDSYDPADDDEEGVTCKRCGQPGLDWIHTGERYRLVDDGGRLHVCQSDHAIGDFEVLE